MAGPLELDKPDGRSTAFGPFGAGVGGSGEGAGLRRSESFDMVAEMSAGQARVLRLSTRVET